MLHRWEAPCFTACSGSVQEYSGEAVLSEKLGRAVTTAKGQRSVESARARRIRWSVEQLRTPRSIPLMSNCGRCVVSESFLGQAAVGAQVANAAPERLRRDLRDRSHAQRLADMEAIIVRAATSLVSASCPNADSSSG